VNPIALAALGWKYYIVFVVVVILYCLTAYFLYPETKGYTLEEMAVIFDGESAHATLDRTTKMTAVAISHVEKGAGYKVAVNEQAQG
jgi:Na+/glutamate symporter